MFAVLFINVYRKSNKIFQIISIYFQQYITYKVLPAESNLWLQIRLNVQLMELQSPKNLIILRFLRGKLFEILLQFFIKQAWWRKDVWSIFSFHDGVWLSKQWREFYTFTINNFPLTVFALNFFCSWLLLVEWTIYLEKNFQTMSVMSLRKFYLVYKSILGNSNYKYQTTVFQ